MERAATHYNEAVVFDRLLMAVAGFARVIMEVNVATGPSARSAERNAVVELPLSRADAGAAPADSATNSG
jgi:hypothetical protein